MNRGQYIAYDATGLAWRVTGAAGNWMGRPSYAGAAGDYRLIMADTLAALAAKIGASRPA